MESCVSSETGYTAGCANQITLNRVQLCSSCFRGGQIFLEVKRRRRDLKSVISRPLDQAWGESGDRKYGLKKQNTLLFTNKTFKG